MRNLQSQQAHRFSDAVRDLGFERPPLSGQLMDFEAIEKDAIDRLKTCSYDQVEPWTDRIVEFLELTLNALQTRPSSLHESRRSELRILRQKVQQLEKRVREIESEIVAEHTLDAVLAAEIESLDKVTIDPERLNPKHWAPTLGDLAEYLDEE